MTPEPEDAAPDDAPVLMLHGALVGLGPLDRRHLPLYLRWMNDPEVTRGLGRAGPFTMEMEERWYENASNLYAGPHFTIYELATLKPIGTTGLTDVDTRRGIGTFGISIGDKTCWNRGYGTEATKLVVDYAFNILGLLNVMLSVYSYNTRAYRAYLKAGFRDIGRRRGTVVLSGRRFDEIFMDILADEFVSPTLQDVLLGEGDANGPSRPLHFSAAQLREDAQR